MKVIVKRGNEVVLDCNDKFDNAPVSSVRDQTYDLKVTVKNSTKSFGSVKEKIDNNKNKYNKKYNNKNNKFNTKSKFLSQEEIDTAKDNMKLEEEKTQMLNTEENNNNTDEDMNFGTVIEDSLLNQMEDSIFESSEEELSEEDDNNTESVYEESLMYEDKYAEYADEFDDTSYQKIRSSKNILDQY